MKKRLDILLFERRLVDSRAKAQALIMAGLVLVNGKKETKVGSKFDEDAGIEVLETQKYVSRGAGKLEKATRIFRIDFRDKVVCDVGSSTGGFTDFVLQHGARKVYAIDVGTGQLHWKLRNDPRIIVMEKTDFRKIENLPEKIDIFVVDVSFVSVRKILESIKYKVSSIKQGAEIVLLFKPQFEAGKVIADRFKGVIKDPRIHERLLSEFRKWCEENGFKMLEETESPIKGAKGNTEFLFLLKII